MVKLKDLMNEASNGKYVDEMKMYEKVRKAMDLIADARELLFEQRELMSKTYGFNDARKLDGYKLVEKLVEKDLNKINKDLFNAEFHIKNHEIHNK
jgi:hypothetical protein